MGKYSPTTRTPKPRVERPHAVWRGIGCLMMIIVPIVSLALAVLTVQSSWAQQYIPYELLGYAVLPSTWWKVTSLDPLLAFIQSLPDLYGTTILFLFYMVVIGAFLSVGNAFLYKMVGPPRYGPQDAEPPKIKARAYKR